MKNILIVLILTLGLGSISGVATFKYFQYQRAAEKAQAPEPTEARSIQEAMRQSVADYADVTKASQDRDMKVLIAAGIGGGCGLMLGIALTNVADKKKAASRPA
jgi:hypothetical protein